ncbi:hypothetical protein F373_gp081 [Bacillus phage SP-10]|uniref:hypothetical protein n=1 Tax=Bacillus phage SP10 TaxID=941058 RepID=UPI0002198B25|nr:hypothetical protein F373_gp081 [Bacillus phage SP-10]BAK52893.1 hypothetical protein [Bacillus phage SP-10]
MTKQGWVVLEGADTDMLAKEFELNGKKVLLTLNDFSEHPISLTEGVLIKDLPYIGEPSFNLLDSLQKAYDLDEVTELIFNEESTATYDFEQLPFNKETKAEIEEMFNLFK